MFPLPSTPWLAQSHQIGSQDWSQGRHGPDIATSIWASLGNSSRRLGDEHDRSWSRSGRGPGGKQGEKDASSDGIRSKDGFIIQRDSRRGHCRSTTARGAWSMMSRRATGLGKKR